MTEANTAIKVGDIQFYDNYVPSLLAGNYKIQVDQQINRINTGTLQSAQEFVVSAPQLALDPLEIHTFYPPNNSTGQYEDCLPHIVLNKRVLPWERKMLNGSKEHIPWMALLVFEEPELLGSEHSDTHAIQTTVGEFIKPDAKVLKPPIEKADDIPSDKTCYYIKVPTAIFADIAPRINEIKYLSHVRQVDTGDKAIMGIKDDGWFSVVVANRFPQFSKTGLKNIVHLVSLEKLEKYLTEKPVFTLSGKEDGTHKYDTIGLLSLARWSFHCLPDSQENFKGLMQHFVSTEYDTQKKVYSPEKLWLRLPNLPNNTGTVEAKQEVQQRLQNGYVPLNYHTRSGEDTFAWYRGPLTPILPTTLTKPTPFMSADAAIIYDNDNGLFDMSLATAWQIGRALALADQSFSKTLLEFRRKSHRLTNLLFERLHNQHFDTPDLNELAQSQLIQTKFTELLQSDLLREIGQKPNSDPGEPVTKIPRAPHNNLQKALEAFLSRPEVSTTVQNLIASDLEPITQWIARLQLLYGVPFYHLVPDLRILPVESIRFFYLDQNWLDAMSDGALTIGMQSSRDTLHYKMTKGLIREGVKKSVHILRQQLRGIESDLGKPNGETHISGILMRSAVVSGWPGLSVRAYSKKEQLPENQLKMLRMDRLSANVLICLFSGIPERLDLSEPQEGFRFGVDEQGAVELRNIVSNLQDKPIGSPLGTYKIRDLTGGKPMYMRGNQGHILNLNPDSKSGLVQALTNELSNKLGKPVSKISPSDFAIQMVKSPEQLTFNPPPA
jgi:hypothetical protein